AAEAFFGLLLLRRQPLYPQPVAARGVERPQGRLGVEHEDATADHDRACREPALRTRSGAGIGLPHLLQVGGQREMLGSVVGQPARLRPAGVGMGGGHDERGRGDLGIRLQPGAGLQYLLAFAGKDDVFLAGAEHAEQRPSLRRAGDQRKRKEDHGAGAQGLRVSSAGPWHGYQPPAAPWSPEAALLSTVSPSRGVISATIMWARWRTPMGAVPSATISLNSRSASARSPDR